MSNRTWSRRSLIAAIVLAAQLVLIVVLLWPRGAVSAPGPLIANFDPAKVAAIRLEDNVDTRNLAKVDGKWALPDSGNFPVNEVSVSQLLTDVAKLDTSRLVAATSTSLDRLKVADRDYVRKITIGSSDGVTRTLYMGSSPAARATHVRLDGSNNVYLTPALSTNDVRMDAGAWINPTYLEAPRERQRRIAIKNKNGDFVLVRQPNGQWSMDGLAAGETINANNLSTLSARLDSLAMVEPLGTQAQVDYGLQPPTATVTLELTPTVVVSGAASAPETVTLDVGAKHGKQDAYVVKSSGSNYFVTAASATLDPFVHYGRSDLVVTAPVTNTATLTGSAPLTPAFEPAPFSPLPTPKP